MNMIASYNGYRKNNGLMILSPLLSYPQSRDAIVSKNMKWKVCLKHKVEICHLIVEIDMYEDEYKYTLT